MNVDDHAFPSAERARRSVTLARRPDECTRACKAWTACARSEQHRAERHDMRTLMKRTTSRQVEHRSTDGLFTRPQPQMRRHARRARRARAIATRCTTRVARQRVARHALHDTRCTTRVARHARGHRISCRTHALCVRAAAHSMYAIVRTDTLHAHVGTHAANTRWMHVVGAGAHVGGERGEPAPSEPASAASLLARPEVAKLIDGLPSDSR